MTTKLLITDKEEMWDILVAYDIATDDEIRLVTAINGYSEQTMINILYARTGYRDFNNFSVEINSND